MCGLFGVVAIDDSRISTDRALAARDRLRHRGPDHAGQYRDVGAFLGHRRLSILDLSEHGRQPMVSEDGAVAVTVNGEIYNFQSLRRELGEERFASDSDSEVILHGYHVWGIEGLLRRVEGMFAFAVYDQVQRRVLLARDRVGIKPLYYASFGDCLAWGSELKAIETYFAGTGRLVEDPTSLYDFLTYRYIPSPKSLYRDVFKLEPAHYLSVDLRNLSCVQRRYWALETCNRRVSPSEAASEVRQALDASVSQQLVSDVDVGFFLSGGLDSSTVVASAARHVPGPRTYAIGFSERSHDETEYAATVAEAFGTRHTREEVSPDGAADLQARMKAWYDEPFGDSSAWPTYEVSALARRSSVVALTGDGGDEVFGGYRWYEAFNRLRDRQQRVSGLLGLFGGGAGPRTALARSTRGSLQQVARRVDLFSHAEPLELYSLLLGAVPWPVRRRYRSILGIPADYDDQWHLRRYYRPELGPYKSLQYMDFHTYLPDDILTKVDRVSMAVSLEARVPFLDTRLVELAFSFPEEIIYPNGELKGLLKQAFADTLPAEILGRGKKGFSIPLHRWGQSAMGGAHTFQEYVLADYLRAA